MATHDYVIDNSTGANVRADINNVLPACVHLRPTRASFQNVLDVETRRGSDHLQ